MSLVNPVDVLFQSVPHSPGQPFHGVGNGNGIERENVCSPTNSIPCGSPGESACGTEIFGSASATFLSRLPQYATATTPFSKYRWVYSNPTSRMPPSTPATARYP